MFGRKSVAAVPARAEQTTRILVVGAVGLDADLCVAWTDPVPNVADFDVAVVLVPSLEIATQVHRDSFYEYQQRFKQLLESDGELYVFADPRESWSEDDRPKIYGTFDNYDWCPIWLTVENSSGTTVVSVDPEFTWYYRNVDRWDLVISHPAHEGDNRRTIDGREHAVLYEWEMLAQNRAKQALSTRVRYSFHLLGYDNRTLASVIRPEPTATAGWAYFIGRAHPWLPDRAAQELLAHR